MLSKKEKKIMEYIFNKCDGKETILISPDELGNVLKPKYDVSELEVKSMVDNLVLDGYISLVMSDKKGKPMYCISLEKKGESFKRDLESERKNLRNLIIRTVLLAILSTLVGLVIKWIF